MIQKRTFGQILCAIIAVFVIGMKANAQAQDKGYEIRDFNDPILDAVPLICIKLETFGKPETDEEIWFLMEHISEDCVSWNNLQGLGVHRSYQSKPAMLYLLQMGNILLPYIIEYEIKKAGKYNSRGQKGAIDWLRDRLAHPELAVPQYMPSSKINAPGHYYNQDYKIATPEEIEAYIKAAKEERQKLKEGSPPSPPENTQPAQTPQPPANPTPPALRQTSQAVEQTVPPASGQAATPDASDSEDAARLTPIIIAAAAIALLVAAALLVRRKRCLK